MHAYPLSAMLKIPAARNAPRQPATLVAATRLARRWYEELKRTNRESVRASLAQTAGSRGGILMAEVSMTIGFARDWLAWHDQQKAVREARFRRWQFAASASVLVAAIGLALKAWLKW